MEKQRHKKGTHFHETGSRDQCQCGIECSEYAIDGEAFCETHIDKCSRESPLTGSEPEYEPNRWNLNRPFRETHNCFAYAMNIFDKKQVEKCKTKKKCDASFHQPGFASGYSGFSNDSPKTCPNMMARIFGDNPYITMTDFTSQCPKGTSKVALIIDESDDYHFVRQDGTGYWSHKPGARKVTTSDARGHKIWDPKLANYDYSKNGNSSLNYDIFCSYMCVPRGVPLYLRAKGGSRSIKGRHGVSLFAPTRPFRTQRTRRHSRGRR